MRLYVCNLARTNTCMHARVLKGAPLEFELNASNLKFFRDVAKLAPPIQLMTQTRACKKKDPLYPEYPHVLFFTDDLVSTQAYCWYKDEYGKRRRITKNVVITNDSDALGTSEEIRRSGAAFLESQYVRLSSGAIAEGEVAGDSSECFEANEEAGM